MKRWTRRQAQDRVVRLVPLALLALAAWGCQSAPEPGAEVSRQGDSLEAVVQPIGGSAVNGSVIFSPTRTGVTMRVYLTGLPLMGYRIVIHANGNCSSPNGFSAGPPLVLPGATDHVLAAIPPARKLSDDSLTEVLRIPGLHLEGPNGIAGRSVVVHVPGDGPLDAQPGVRNDRAACGVIGKPRAPIF